MEADEYTSSELDDLSTAEDLSEEMIASFRFTDVEASSLHSGSHPIEVAGVGVDLAVEAMLIRPLPGWDDWSVMSQNVHNISREMLERDGEDANLVALRLNAMFTGNPVFSDNVGFDGAWLVRLFEDTGIRATFGLQDLDLTFRPCRKIAAGFMGPNRLARLLRRVETVFPHTHRAGDDVLKMAATVRVMVDREWADWFEKADYEALQKELGSDPGRTMRR